MAKKQTTKKTKSNKVVGSGGLAAKPKLSWKRIVPLVVLVSIVGGYWVFGSHAAARAFEINAYAPGKLQLNGGTVIRGSNGKYYRQLYAYGKTYGNGPYLATRNGGAVPCAYFRIWDANTKVRLLVSGREVASGTYAKGGQHYSICGKRIYGSPTITLAVDPAARGKVQVNKIYAYR